MACISLPTAMLIGTGVSGLGSLASALIGSNAASSAAATQAAGAKNALGVTKKMYKDISGKLQPYIDTGTNVGLTGVKNLLGAGNLDSGAIQAALEQLPGYQFALKQGLQAAQSGFSAKGLGQSGAAIKGAADYASGLASQTYNTLFGNFLDTARLGEAAGSALGGVASNFNSSINNLITGGASATAAGQIGSANALTGGIGKATDAISNGALMLGLNNAGFFGNAGGSSSGGSNSLVPAAWVANGALR